MGRWIVLSGLVVLPTMVAAQEPVRLVRDQAAVSGCRSLGEVQGSSLIGGALGGVGYDNAMNEMRSKAATAGGNHLLLIDMQSGMMGAKGIGEAYRCDAQDSSGSPAQKKPARR